MSLVRKHPLVSFFALAYALSWGYWIPLAFAGVRVSAGSRATHFPGLLGPALAALIVTGLTDEKVGIVALARRMVLISCPILGFWLYVLSPLVFLVLVLIAATLGQMPLPPGSDFALYSGLPPLGLSAIVLLVVRFNGFGEETGWRGFALAPLQGRFGAVTGTFVLALQHVTPPTSSDEPRRIDQRTQSERVMQ